MAVSPGTAIALGISDINAAEQHAAKINGGKNEA